MAQLVKEIKLASENIKSADDANRHLLDGIEASVNELFKRTGRPGDYADFSNTDERKDAGRRSGLYSCRLRELGTHVHDRDQKITNASTPVIAVFSSLKRALVVRPHVRMQRDSFASDERPGRMLLGALTLTVLKHPGDDTLVVDEDLNMCPEWRMARIGDVVLLEKPADDKLQRRIDC